jgi:hypothetical protein
LASLINLGLDAARQQDINQVRRGLVHIVKRQSSRCSKKMSLFDFYQMIFFNSR